MAKRTTAPAPYIQKRRQRFYAVLEIPKALRPRFGGKVRFVQSLGTESLSVAKNEVHAIVAGWKEQLADAEWPEIDYMVRGKEGSRWVSRPVTPPAVMFQKLRNAKSKEERDSILEEIAEAADHIGSINADLGKLPSTAPEAQEYHAKATGAAGSVATGEFLDEWLAIPGGTAKTKDLRRGTIGRLAEKFPMLSDIERPEVRRWVTDLLGDDLALATVRRMISDCRGYWRHLQTAGVVEEDAEPFSNLNLPRQQNGNTRDKRKPFSASEVSALLSAAIKKGDDQLADLIRLGMWTGCRIEEICALKVEHVHAGHIQVVEGKSKSAVREVPIHRKLAQTMARLINESQDGYILSGLSENKYGDRSNAIGKRFGRLKKAMGFGPELVFHSLRKCVATQLENTGCPENIAASILGHDFPTMTFGLYSGGPSLKVKAAALAKLKYPLQAQGSQSAAKGAT